MSFLRILSHVPQAFFSFESRAHTGVFTKVAPLVFARLTQALSAPRLVKLPSALPLLGSRFIQSNPSTKSSFPQHQQINSRAFSAFSASDVLAAPKDEIHNQGLGDVNLEGLCEGVSKSLDALKALKGKEAVLFIGETGSGKSTTLNVMMGIPVQILKVNSLGVATLNVNQPDAFKIGSTKYCETEVLEAKLESYSQMWLTDCPSCHDNRLKTRQFVSDISCYLATQTVRKVKAIVVVISIGIFDQNRKSLEDVALMLHNLVKNGVAAKESIFFMFTKSLIRETGDFLAGQGYVAYSGRLSGNLWRENTGYYVYPAKKGEIIHHIEDVLISITDKPKKDQTKADKAVRDLIELIIGDEARKDRPDVNSEGNRLEGERMFVINITDRHQRKDILDTIARAPGIEKDQFHPKIKGAVQEIFKKSIIYRLGMGLQARELFALRDHEEDLKLGIEWTHTEISRIEDQHRQLQNGAPLDVVEYAKSVKDQIRRCEEIEKLLKKSRELMSADINVTVQGSKDSQEDVELLLKTLRRDHDLLRARLERLATEKSEAESSLKNLVATSSSIEGITSKKSKLEQKANSQKNELLLVRNQIAALEGVIGNDKEALNKVLNLIQFDLISRVLDLDQNLVSHFTKTMSMLNADPKFENKSK